MGNNHTKPAAVHMEVSAPFSNLQDDITCSVCLHELQEPVAITCGHTFCKVCITSYWATRQVYQCPECRKVCIKTQLIPVYRLQNMVERVQLANEEQSRQASFSTVNLVYTDFHGRLQLDESIVQRCFLDDKIKDLPLCLICVIGEKRRGKSTLMNYILRALQCLARGQSITLGEEDEPLKGFDWFSGTDSITKGIWMWSRPFILERNEEKMAVFVLDTEGSLDTESDQETSMKLSALSMLVSSYLIFNVNASLKTTELDYLEMYLHVAELMVESFPLQHLQHLDFLVRDWQNPDKCGHDPARTYLEHEAEVLRRTSRHPKVLQTLRSPSIDGFLLPHPGNRFLRSDQGRLADMEEDFRSHFTRYVSSLVGRVWNHPKTDIHGQMITCAQLAGNLKEFFGLLQKQRFSFASPLEMFCSLQNYKNMNNVVKKLQDFMESQAPSSATLFEVLGLKPSELRSRVDDKVSALLEEYTTHLKGENQEEKELLADEMRTRLTKEQERFCDEYSKRFMKRAVGIGCAVGGGVLTLAGGVVGAAVAGVVLSAEAAIVALGAVGGSVSMGAIGTGVGAGVGGIIGHRERKKAEGSEHGGDEDASGDTQQLLEQEEPSGDTQQLLDQEEH